MSARISAVACDRTRKSLKLELELVSYEADTFTGTPVGGRIPPRLKAPKNAKGADAKVQEPNSELHRPAVASAAAAGDAATVGGLALGPTGDGADDGHDGACCSYHALRLRSGEREERDGRAVIGDEGVCKKNGRLERSKVINPTPGGCGRRRSCTTRRSARSSRRAGCIRQPCCRPCPLQQRRPERVQNKRREAERRGPAARWPQGQPSARPRAHLVAEEAPRSLVNDIKWACLEET